MIYAYYGDYTDAYFGDLIPAEDFDRCAARASDYLDQLTMNRAEAFVTANPDDMRVKKATCALAEQFYLIGKARATVGDGEIASESVGSHSVSYRSGLDTATQLTAQLKNIAAQYLLSTGLLYRGVNNVHASYSYTDYS